MQYANTLAPPPLILTGLTLRLGTVLGSSTFTLPSLRLLSASPHYESTFYCPIVWGAHSALPMALRAAPSKLFARCSNYCILSWVTGHSSMDCSAALQLTLGIECRTRLLMALPQHPPVVSVTLPPPFSLLNINYPCISLSYQVFCFWVSFIFRPF